MVVLTTYIYSINCPLTNNPRYIGKADHPKERWTKHLRECRIRTTSHKNAWLKSLLIKGLKPEFEIIDEVPKSEWKFWEIYYISLYKSWGFDLTNETQGGEAGVGRKPGFTMSKASRKKMSITRKDRIITPEWRINIGLGTKKVREGWSEEKWNEYGNNLSKALTGKKKTPLAIENRKKSILKKYGKFPQSNKIVLDTQSGVFYDSLKEISQLMGISKTYLSMMINNKIKNKTNLKYV